MKTIRGKVQGTASMRDIKLGALVAMLLGLAVEGWIPPVAPRRSRKDPFHGSRVARCYRMKPGYKLQRRRPAGVNAPCPCGSDRKYKQCCGH